MPFAANVATAPTRASNSFYGHSRSSFAFASTESFSALLAFCKGSSKIWAFCSGVKLVGPSIVADGSGVEQVAPSQAILAGNYAERVETDWRFKKRGEGQQPERDTNWNYKWKTSERDGDVAVRSNDEAQVQKVGRR